MITNFTPGDQDVVIAGGLITSPAWAGWLGELNEVFDQFFAVIWAGAWRDQIVAGLSGKLLILWEKS